ncbi:hypothetical protein ACCS99_35920, partial [Rhizobium ruizarguesonis]
SAMKSARALGFATSRHLHHVPGHDHHITYQNGMMTWWGLLETTELLTEIAVFGIAAGGLFWLIAAAGIKKQPPSKVFD